MKKLLIVFVFAAAFLTASFGAGRIEISTRPMDTRQRDEQWMQAQRNQERQQQQRDQWQREQWQRDQHQRAQRHEQSQEYDWWLQRHSRDYDNRR
jgi:hypothetical protein